MGDYAKQITREMVELVDRLEFDDFENATADEIKEYARFKTLIALDSEEFKNRHELRVKESAERKEQNAKQAKSAMDALNALTELAQAKLALVETEIEKTKKVD